MTSNKIYFRIIDCRKSLDRSTCEDYSINKSVCEWVENISVYPCSKDDKDLPPRDQCLPVNFSTSACGD